jgi:hypothetical protein
LLLASSSSFLFFSNFTIWENSKLHNKILLVRNLEVSLEAGANEFKIAHSELIDLLFANSQISLLGPKRRPR